MTHHERARRNTEIVEARARGLSWPTIAVASGLSERHCRRVVADFRASAPRLHDTDPVEVIEDALHQYRDAAEELALIAGQTGNESVRVGAIKARLDCLRSTTALMQEVGVLPHDLGQLAVEIDVRQMVVRVLAVFDELDLSVEVQRRLIDAIDPRGAGHPSTADGRPVQAPH